MFDDFSTIIKDLRLQHQLTQEQLARKLDVSLSTISRWERGVKVMPTTKNLLDICVLFGVSINYLVGIEENKTIVIDMLTPEQQDLLETMVMEFQSEKRSHAKLTYRQNEIIQQLFEEFSK
ncbi:helix-turn-helix domain-containing protein [[Clostridium] leptum]|nr:helix-turn-helix domain-containing protein [[Clostridium] leptum]